MEAQRSQKAVLENIKDAKDFDVVKRYRHIRGQNGNRDQRKSVKEKKIIKKL